MRCGLLGKSLSHSYSPVIHNALASYDYELFQVPPEALDSFMRCEDFHGLNVTIPYKKAVIPYCSALTPQARRLGAVNTLVRQHDGSLLGANTDYFGFESTVKKTGLKVNDKKVLILGTGGAAATVHAVLEDMGAKPVFISRTGENNYGNLHLHQDAAVIVNATPVGMYPNNGESPVNLDTFPCLEGVIDLIYNPANTALLMQAQKRKIVAENGLYMLVAQAKQSAVLFSGKDIEDTAIEKVYAQLKAKMENIILIGMPGCGKSTVGQLVANLLGREFVDADAEIVNEAKMPIADIFALHGEKGFRAVEAKVLARLGIQSGLVIATGGGCVTVPENYNSLHQNGKILWLKRATEQLPTEGRPLSKQGALEAMYKARQPLYSHFCDISIDNNGSVKEAARAVITAIYGEEHYENTCD